MTLYHPCLAGCNHKFREEVRNVKNKAINAILTFVAVIRSLFPQLGLLQPSEYRFEGDEEREGHLAGIVDERNGVLDIADGAEHVVFKFPPGTKVGRMRWNASGGDARQLFRQLDISLALQPIFGSHQTLAEYDLENGVVVVKRGNRYAAFTIPRGTPVDIHRTTYRERR